MQKDLRVKTCRQTPHYADALQRAKSKYLIELALMLIWNRKKVDRLFQPVQLMVKRLKGRGNELCNN